VKESFPGLKPGEDSLRCHRSTTRWIKVLQNYAEPGEEAAAIRLDVADQHSRSLRDEVFEGLFEPESIDLDVL
jgi:hypothetical protein